MEIKCPACRKINYLENQVICQRCGCDLTRLQQIEIWACDYLTQGQAFLIRNDWKSAFNLARQSWNMHHSKNSALMAILAAIGMHDTMEILRWQKRCREFNG